ncbi:hypothetical protein C8K30_1011039 [Promicromonospora sp. AC04]|uniref:hypothetical protein n=1 Tax=Promicromonospora sp. AC04 TaxID=2135723 RepID=UPI000D394503|nr:hypothetical protein [Promicromonospora sp. AC04]PUB32513.1 hypothetical protein C8K30_1011039 [Promicromonospora sp. AC04]
MTSVSGRDQRLKPCAGGCGRTTRAVHCKACFAKIPARERAGSFGRFQLRRSHLVTNGDVDSEPLPLIAASQAADARLTVAVLALRHTSTGAEAVEAAREVVSMLGIGDATGSATTP